MMVWIVIKYQKYLETVRSDRIVDVFDSHAKALSFITEMKSGRRIMVGTFILELNKFIKEEN